MSEQTRIILTVLGGLCLTFMLVTAALVWRYYGLLARNANARLSYLTLEGRCRCITDAVADVWPDIGELRGEEYVRELRKRIADARQLHVETQRLLCGVRNPEAPGLASVYFVSIEGVKRAAFMLESYKTGRVLALPPGLSVAAGDMVFNFASAMLVKLADESFRRAGNNENPDGWAMRHDTWPLPECQEALLEAVAKGDPVDVANYAAFLHFHEEETSLMGYMSMTPALEAVVRQVLGGVTPHTLNMMAESKVQPGFTINTIGERTVGEVARKHGKRVVLMGHERGILNSHDMHALMEVAEKLEVAP